MTVLARQVAEQTVHRGPVLALRDLHVGFLGGVQAVSAAPRRTCWSR